VERGEEGERVEVKRGSRQGRMGKGGSRHGKRRGEGRAWKRRRGRRKA
jgi:hypothetical protein